MFTLIKLVHLNSVVCVCTLSSVTCVHCDKMAETRVTRFYLIEYTFLVEVILKFEGRGEIGGVVVN